MTAVDEERAVDEEDLVPFEPEPDVVESSLIASLRARRERAARDRFYDVEVPGYNRCLVIRLGPVPGRMLTSLRERGERSASPDKDWDANADLLIAACRAVLARQSPDAELEPIDPEVDPTKLDEHLAELMGFRAKKARDVVAQLFDLSNNPQIAAGMAVADYVEWSRQADSDLNEEFVGESPAATP